MVRLSVGLVVIGAGLSRVRFMPTVESGSLFGLLLTGTGFLILLGLAVRPAALVALGAYVVTLRGSSRAGDDARRGRRARRGRHPWSGPPVTRRPAACRVPARTGGARGDREPGAGRYDDLVPLLVRLGLGGAFIASGIADKLLIYDQALAAVDRYELTSVVPVSPELWVVGAAIVETALGVAIVLGVLTRLAAVVGFTVLTLALFALPDDPVIAHVCLFGLCSVLVVLGAGRWSLDRVLLAPLGERIRRAL